MKFQLIEPTGFLKYYIKHYCFMESDIYEGDVVERVIPTENVQLMFHYKNPFAVCQPDGSAVKQPRSIISGLCSSFSDVSTQGSAGVVFLTFQPNGACHFFRFPLTDIENTSVNLSDIFNSDIMRVEESLYLNSSIRERVLVIEEFLMKRFSPIPVYDDLIIQKGVEIIKLCKGQTTVNSLSCMLSLSRKSLERKFSRYLGKTTKQFIKLVRFQEVVSELCRSSNLNLTHSAFANGYYDQSHFIKDFKAFSGLTPKEFVSRYSDCKETGEIECP